MNYQQFQQYFSQIGQQHILQKAKLATQDQKNQLLAQVNNLQNIYPGGLKAYVERARKLLNASKNNINPYQGFIPSVPKGIDLDFYNENQITHYQTIGEKQLRHTGFVLVAGGLGERLGYKGIKVQIPIDVITQTCFLKYYISYILAIQHKYCLQNQFIPLAIMTSDDTKSLTQILLQKNNYFGLKKQQLIIMKQQKIPSMLDNDARFALQSNKLLIETKPHGHGDVHTLLYQHKITKQWQSLPNKIKWLVFFQDTNPLIFRSLTPVIGVSSQLNLQMNSVGVRRKPGEAVGAITRLTNNDGNQLVINVEYNQLEGLLKSVGGQKVDQSGYSVYPGNINVLIFQLQKYHNVLKQTGGNISEFINPKYADNTKTKFKSSARLQCMMQDYPKLLSSSKNVGFTMIDKRFCFSTVKNDIKSAAQKFKNKLAPESASSCQNDFNWLNRQLLKISGAIVEQGQQQQFSDIRLRLFPTVFLHPQFGVTLKQIRNKVKKVKISKNSSLVINKDCVLEQVEVDGKLIINEGGNIKVKQQGKNYLRLQKVKGNQAGYILIRGYRLQK